MDANSIVVVREASGYGPAVITAFSILLAALFTSLYGLRAYFKKREHEQIMKRYLEEGIDRAMVSIEHAVGVFVDNNRTVWNVVRALQQKKAGLIIEKKDYSPAFRKYEQKYFYCTPFLKIQLLVGDIVFWKSTQLLYAFVDSESMLLEKDFSIAVKNVIEDKKNISLEALLETTREKQTEYHKAHEKYLHILRELDLIAAILEKESNLTWSKLDEIKNRPDVKKSVQTLKDIFSEEIKCSEQKSEEDARKR